MMRDAADPSSGAKPVKIISWNLLRLVGAPIEDVVRLVRLEQPDLLLLQEVTEAFETICDHLGGDYVWRPQPGRVHGLGMWSPTPWVDRPAFSPLPRGAWFERIDQIATVGGFGVANVHLSHGQRLNRLQLRAIAERLPERAAVMGDFNIVGPALLADFHDIGPRWPTHRMSRLVPVRLDRCLARGLYCEQARVLPRFRSDHHPICVTLRAAEGLGTPRQTALRYKEAAGEALRRAPWRRRSVPRGAPGAAAHSDAPA